MQLLEVPVQIRESDPASKRKDSNALAFSGKVAWETVVIGNPFNGRGRTRFEGISIPRVKWLCLAEVFKSEDTLDNGAHLGREKYLPLAALASPGRRFVESQAGSKSSFDAADRAAQLDGSPCSGLAGYQEAGLFRKGADALDIRGGSGIELPKFWAGQVAPMPQRATPKFFSGERH